MGLLDVTFTSNPLVGSNLRGGASGAGWLYCLPRLDYEHVTCVGAPRPATLAGLVRAGADVTVLAEGLLTRRRVRRLVAERGWTNVIVRGCGPAAVEGQGPAIDLLVVVDSGGSARRCAQQLLARLTDDGVACYLGTDSAPGPGNGSVQTLAMTPSRGEVRAVVPLADAAMRSAFEQLGLQGTVLSRPKLARWERQLADRFGLHARPRFATLVGGPAVDLSVVPHYLSTIAADAGFPLEGWSYGVFARGAYDSQKVLVLLTPPQETAPTVVVKVTRSRKHAARLQNETSRLTQLAGLEIADQRTPKPHFSGFHAGRAVLGQTLMAGVPYELGSRRGSQAAEEQLADAMGWLTSLGAATAHEVPASDMAAILLTLLDSYAQIYRPAASEVTRLGTEFERLGALSQPLPSVLQHGDPGVWNLLVDDRGRTLFLDWEAGEPDGMPLWDVLYLFRSHAIEAGRRAGVRDRAQAASRHLTGDSALSDLLVDTIGTYCRQVGLPPAAVEPLIFGCWIHRSIKESSRSHAGRLHEGLSVRLIRRMLADPDASVTRRLRALG